MATTTTYQQHMVVVGAITPKGIGIETDETEDVIDQRDGREIQRKKLRWLARSRCKLVKGELERGKPAVLEIPDWHWQQVMSAAP